MPIFCHIRIDFPTGSGKSVKKEYVINIPKTISTVEVIKMSSSRLAVFNSSLVNSSEKS